MVNLVAFETVEEIEQLTGKTCEELYKLGFNLDDWNIGFQSDTKIHVEPTKDEIERNIYEEGELVESYDMPCYWLLGRMKDYCAGASYAFYNGKHYYFVHH